MKKCWHINYDRSYTNMQYDDSENCEHKYCESYEKYSEAHKQLVTYFDERVKDFKYALQNARKIRRSNFNTSTKIMTPEQYKTWTKKIVRG